MVRRGLVIALVLAGGALGGFVLSELIGIVGYRVTGRAVGIRYLPLILPIAGLGVALLVLRHEALRKSLQE